MQSRFLSHLNKFILTLPNPSQKSRFLGDGEQNNIALHSTWWCITLCCMTMHNTIPMHGDVLGCHLAVESCRHAWEFFPTGTLFPFVSCKTRRVGIEGQDKHGDQLHTFSPYGACLPSIPVSPQQPDAPSSGHSCSVIKGRGWRWHHWPYMA